jgi:hypothetical protein
MAVFDNSGGFESRLAGKKYFWQTPIFWRIWPILQSLIFIWRIWRNSGGFRVAISKKPTLLKIHLAFFFRQDIKSYFFPKKIKEEKYFTASEIRQNPYWKHTKKLPLGVKTT